MGAGNSALSSNVAAFAQGIDLNVTNSCSAEAAQTMNKNQVTLGNVDCLEGVNIGDQYLLQEATCNQAQTAVAIAQASAMQNASSTSGILSLFSNSKAENSVDVQQTITETLQSRCDGSANQSVANEAFTMGNVDSNGVCNILNQALDQKFACMISQMASASTSASVSQVATATTGITTAGLIALCIMALVGLIFFAVLRRTLLGGQSQHGSDEADFVKAVLSSAG